ncbi:MAG: PQQ-dependent sugar dehydrogenase [Pirellulales bacterium]|nr:PQQ-dependent sugar dehydrogenase [Pirellulales bacterium]
MKTLTSPAKRSCKVPSSRRLQFELLEGRRLLATLFRINAGGPELAGSPVWQADTAAAPSSFSNASAGNTATATTAATINMTHASLPLGTPMALFQAERFDKSGAPNMLWDFPVTPGQFEVRLYFAETWSGAFANGVRVFDVQIEGAMVLDNYDVFAEVGANKGVMNSFVVTSDANLDIDFLRVVQNPAIKGIEILSVDTQPTGGLSASSTSLNFGTAVVGQPTSQQVTLTNSAPAGGASITIDPAQATISPTGQYSVDFGGSTAFTLAPGQSRNITVTYTPTNTNTHTATLSIPHNGAGSPLQISLTGTGATSVPISFGKSVLGGTTGLNRPTSLQFGPDGRLYVSQQDGVIRAYTINRTGTNDYDVVAQEIITIISDTPNRNDNGALNSGVLGRLVTGILVTGTATQPAIYVCSSDPRIGGGANATDLNLDTNSGILSRLMKVSGSWQKLDLVRGLPRSEENHTANGLQLDTATNTLYIAQGGNTNMGATSNSFSFLPEFALSAAILSVDLDAIGNTTYDLPTLDDETRATQNDANDPFGGNDGLNQAKIVPGGPVQVFAPGFRNSYDLLIHSTGRMYTVDNGPNAGWGDIPINEGPQGTATNEVNEPGVTHGDGLHLITGQGYYGGHPNPTRANTNNKFNTSNPQSPVPVANPIEGDYLIPGVEDGSLVVYPESTNGIVEYTSTHFGNAMKGDLIIASFDNTIKRVKLSADGTQVISSTNLFTNVGFRPLDVTAPPSGSFAGSIWVCDVAEGTITVFEPNDTVSGDPDDLDGDGYTNDDEIANGTDPNNPGDIPPDYDADFISNLTDPNDDNDAFPDTSDKFAVDAANGTTTPIGTFYGWENEGENLGGILGMGFTGLMTNVTSDYESLFDPSKVTAGGAAGVFTIDSAMPGTAKGAANTQKQAFQFGVNVGSATTPFVARTSILGPFNGIAPQPGQEMGFYIGTGVQDDFIQLVLSGDNGGSIKLGKEVNGSFTTVSSQNLAMPGSGFVELCLTIDPVTDTLQASYSLNGAAFINLGGTVVVPSSWIASVMAVGLISTDPTASGAMPVTWDFLGVEPTAAPPGDGAAKIEVYSEGSIDNSSTAKLNSFRLHNTSTNARQLSSIAIDLSTTFMPDMVYDPAGTGGDTVGIAFAPNSGGAATGQSTHQYSAARDGGFDKLEVFFTNFDPGETFTFRLDIDPTSIKGSAAPGPGGSAHVSGLEISGATVTVNLVGGGSLTGQLSALPEGASFYKVHSEVVLNSTATPASPALSLVGVGTAPTIVNSASQTIRVTGAPGAKVRMLQTEVALHLDGVPNGGYDIDPYEANKVVFVRDDVATIGSGGFVDILVTLRDSRIEGGINYFAAVVETSDGKTSNLSNVIKVALKDLPPGSVGSLLSASVVEQTSGAVGDYDDNGQVDGADFLLWQQTLGSAAGAGTGADGSGSAVVDGEDLSVWQDNFGASGVDDFPETLNSSSASLSRDGSNSLQEETADGSGTTIAFDLNLLWQWGLAVVDSIEVDHFETTFDRAFQQFSLPPAGLSGASIDQSAARALVERVGESSGYEKDLHEGFGVEEELSNLDVAFSALE